jgi:hypothetical protein
MSRLSIDSGSVKNIIYVDEVEDIETQHQIITHNVLSFLDGRECFSRNNALFCTKFNVLI